MTAARDGQPAGRPRRPLPVPAARGGSPVGQRGGPQSLGAALSQLFALKGYGNDRSDAQLADAWKAVAGERIAERTAVLGVSRGVLQIGVSSAAMLGELASFHKDRIVGDLKAKYPALKLRDIKFRLRGDLAKPGDAPAKGAKRGRPTNPSNQGE